MNRRRWQSCPRRPAGGPRPLDPGRTSHRRPSDDRGQALLEFALVAPLLLILIIGLFDIGRLVYINNALAEAAREGARFGAVQGRSATAQDAIRSEVLDRTVAVPNPTIGISCQPSCRPGNFLSVEVSSAVAPVTPIIGQFIGPITLSSVSTMTIHQ